jgi:nucleotide-binding universal stress UspA family protein
MIKLQRILVPTDLSEYSLKALPYARELARSQAGLLVLASAVATRAETESMRQALEVLGQGLGVPFEALVGVGAPVRTLIDLAAEARADLVVMSTHGRQGLSRRLLGSTAEGLVLGARCPVLTVKHPQREFLVEDRGAGEVHLRIRKILAPTDYSMTSMEGVEMARKLAFAYRADLILLHVLDEAEATMLVEGSGAPRAAQEVPLQLATAADEIVRAAEEGRADLIVMSTRGHRGMLADLMGSTTQAVVRRARCPVLTLRADWEISGTEPEPAASAASPGGC